MPRRGEPDPATAAAQRIARECIAIRVRRLSRAVTRIFDEALRPHGVTTAQLNVLVAITLAGRMRPSELARALDLEKSTVSRNLERMRANGWVRAIAEGGENGRVLEVLPAGRALLARALPAWASAQERSTREVGSTLAAAIGRAGGGGRMS